MNHVKLLKEYLANRRLPPEQSGFPFITISRQAGAGGHLLSYVIMTDFIKQQEKHLFDGWHVFDKDLCNVIANDPLFPETADIIRYEQYKPEFKKLLETLFTGRDAEYLAYKKTIEIVHALAAIGKVIIVGRAGCCVTRDLPGGIRIRLVAPEASRRKWMVRRFKLSEEEARLRMQKDDSDRRKMMKNFFNRDIDDPLLYDAVWNTDTVDMHEISYSVIEMIRQRQTRTSEKPHTLPSQKELAHFFNFNSQLK